jgi:hypothetical protein
MTINEVTIMPEPVYRIRHAARQKPSLWSLGGRIRYKYFVGNRRQCSRRIAWWYIWDKYGNTHTQAETEKATGLECFCEEPDGEGWPWNDCPIHDRTKGYLARLAARMERFVYADFDLLILKRDIAALESRCKAAKVTP